ncbi:amidohydrolase family protein [Catenulispora yoronensis]
MASAVLRTAEAGPVRGPDQRIAVTEALRAYTMSGARQDGAEDWKGSIEVGKVADLCVLAADPLTAPPRRSRRSRSA